MKTTLTLAERVAAPIVEKTNAKFIVSDSSFDTKYPEEMHANCIECTDLSDDLITNIVIKEDVRLMVMDAGSEDDLPQIALTLLDKAFCPVLLMPESKELTAIKRIAYATDLRFCDLAVTKYLTELAALFNADIFIIHVSANDLPDLDDRYAEKLFKKELAPHIHYKHLDFINLKGPDIVTEIELICEVMAFDMLALVNRKQGCYERMFPLTIKKEIAYRELPLLIYPKL